MVEKYDVKIGSLKYYLFYFIENFKVSFKIAMEYKANLFSILILKVFYFIIIILFGSILFNEVINIQNFGFKEYVLFIFLFNLYTDLVGLFWYGDYYSLSNLIKSGDFSNFILIRPLRPFFGHLFLRRFNPVPFSLFDIILFLPLLSFLFDFQMYIILLSILLLFIISLFGILFIKFLESFTWIFIESYDFLLEDLYFKGVQENIGRFPMMLFDKNFTLMLFLGGFGFYYISMWILPLLIIGNFEVRNYEILMIFFVSIISVTGIIINWRYGLKRYEAFGG